jgi:hypothetical protein
MKTFITLIAAGAGALVLALPAFADAYGKNDAYAKHPHQATWTGIGVRSHAAIFRPDAGWCIENPCFN